MDRKKRFINGVLLSLVLTATPFLFYIYKFAPVDSKEWDTIFGTITSGGFGSVQSFLHALFTKISFVLLTGIWFVTATNWWKYSILVPFTMFLFQLSGTINFQLQYIDEYDFLYSLTFITPIIFFLVYISYRISKRPLINTDLEEDVVDEISKILSDEL